MTTTVQRERELYAGVLGGIDAYGDMSPGEKHAALFSEMTGALPRSTVLDAGAGTGKGALALKSAGFVVEMCDLTFEGLVPESRGIRFHEACLWSNLRSRVGEFDYVYCTDVLEHMPPEYTMLVVTRLFDACRRGAFFSVSLVEDHFGYFAGEPLHKTVRSFVWWRDRFAELGRLVEARDRLSYGVYFVDPGLRVK